MTRNSRGTTLLSGIPLTLPGYAFIPPPSVTGSVPGQVYSGCTSAVISVGGSGRIFGGAFASGSHPLRTLWTMGGPPTRFHRSLCDLETNMPQTCAEVKPWLRRVRKDLVSVGRCTARTPIPSSLACQKVDSGEADAPLSRDICLSPDKRSGRPTRRSSIEQRPPAPSAPRGARSPDRIRDLDGPS
jgi:hypothetical protein